MKDLNIELWLPVMNYEGHYEVSNFGNVRSVARFTNHKVEGYTRVVHGRLMSKTISKRDGYEMVGIKKDGIRETKKVHRLVCESFIVNPFNKPQVNHKDGNKINNTVSNLEWATSKENVHHAIKTGLNKLLGANGMGHKIIAFDRELNKVGEYESIRKAGLALNVRGQNICSILKGRGKWAKGYTFKLAS